jgi:O-antigen ligase
MHARRSPEGLVENGGAHLTHSNHSRPRDRWRPPLLGFAVLAVMAALVVALLDLGAAPAQALYRLSLALLAATLAVLAAHGRAAARTRSEALVLGVGMLLLAASALLPTALATGYVHLFAGWAALFVAFRAARASRRLASLLLVALGAAAAGEAVWAVAQGMGAIPTLTGTGEAGGTLYNPNHLAGLVNMGLGLTLGGFFLALADSSRRRPASERIALAWILVLGCAGMTTAVFLTRSRGGLLATGVMLAFGAFLLLGGGRGTHHARERARVALPAVALLALGVAGGAYALGLDRLAPFARLDDSVARLRFYRDSARLVLDHPLAGVGPGMYRWRFRPYQTETAHSLYQHAHNDYLETAAEWGVPLAVAAWALVGSLLVRSVRTFRESGDPWRRGVALGCGAAILSILVHSLIDFDLQTPANLVVFAAIAGVAWAVVRTRSEERGEEPAPRALAPAAARTGLVALFVVCAVLAGWRFYRRLQAEQVLAVAASWRSLETAARLDPSSAEAHFRLGIAHRDGLARQDPRAARRELEQAVALQPFDWRYHVELAWVHELQGRPREAERELIEAVRLNPHAAEYRWRLGNFYLRQNDLARAAPELIAAGAADGRLAAGGFRLALKGAGGYAELSRRWPAAPTSRLGLLRLACAAGVRGSSPDLVAFVDREWSILQASAPSIAEDEGSLVREWLAQRRETTSP